MALLGCRDRNGDAHMQNEITGGDGQEDYDVPPPAVSVRKVQQFVREKEIEANSEATEVLWIYSEDLICLVRGCFLVNSFLFTYRCPSLGSVKTHIRTTLDQFIIFTLDLLWVTFFNISCFVGVNPRVLCHTLSWWHVMYRNWIMQPCPVILWKA